MSLYESIKTNLNEAKDVTGDFKLDINPVSYNDIWLSFTGSGVEGSAKVFIEGSEFGIPRFRKISKLSYSTKDDECNYDRGWDVKPKNKELFTKICKALEAYRDAHPYSLDESVYVPTPEEAIEFGNNLEKIDTTRKPIIAPGLVTKTIERRQYSDDSWYQFEDLHRKEIGEFYRREGTHHVDPLENEDIYEEFKDFLIDYYTKNPKEIPWMSHPINEADDSYSLNTSIKDWYKTEFSEDDYGDYLKDGVTFKQLYDALGTTEDIYEVIFNGDYGDSIVRERLFGELSDLMNVDYDVIYYKWLYGTEDGKSPNLTEADDNSTEIIKGVIKSKNLPNGTKVSSITDDTFNSIVKDVQSKIPNSDEKDIRNKVAGTLYGMFEESEIWTNVAEDEDDYIFLDADLDEIISSDIEKQCFRDYLVLFGVAANWRGSYAASKVINVDDFKSIMFPDYDSHIRLCTDNSDNVYYVESTHDTPTGGTEIYLYSFKNEDAYFKAENKLKELLEDEDFSMMDFESYADYKTLEILINAGILTNVKISHSINESEDATEKYWDATTLKQDQFLRLMKFNFTEPHGCQYIITNDANEIERFSASSDEEALEQYNLFLEGLDSGLIELIPQDLNIKPIVPRD